MRLRLAAVAAFAVLVFAAPARADLLIQIDKAAQQMTVSADGEPLYTWPVSTGIARYDTPAGAYTPFRKEKEHYSREWDDAPMPYSIFFTKKGHAIHGTYHRSLGQPASHGCVRLSVKNASILWELVAKHKMANTMVVLTGEIPGGGAAVARATQDGDIADDEPAPRRSAPGWRGYADDPRYGRERPYYYQRRSLFGGFPFGW